MGVYTKRPPCPADEFQRIAKAVEKMADDKLAEASYLEAIEKFSPAQMGALHRRLKELADDYYYRDAEPM